MKGMVYLIECHMAAYLSVSITYFSQVNGVEILTTF